MSNFFKIVLLILLVSFFFQNCTSSKNSDTMSDKKEDYKNVKMICEEFCITLQNKNFDEMIELVDNTSKNRVLELKNSDNAFLNNVSFKKVDTCFVNGNEATCSCEFTKNNVKIYDHFKLLKYKEGWLVQFDWGINHVNPFVSDITANFKENYPPYKPNLIDSTEKSNFNNALEIICGLIHHPKNVAGFLKKDDFSSQEFSRDSIYNLVINGEVVNKAGWNILIKYKDITITVLYIFGEQSKLFKLEFSIAAKKYNQFAYVQAIAEAFSDKYGKPYNAIDVPKENYYQYQNLKWFIKGFNEELHLTHEEYFVKISMVKAEHLYHQ